jgi:hypothetical protein
MWSTWIKQNDLIWVLHGKKDTMDKIITSHSGECNCYMGNCVIHQRMEDWMAEWNNALCSGTTWGDIMYKEEMYNESIKTPEEKLKESEEKLKEAKQSEIDLLSYEMRLKAERIAIKNGLMANKRGPVEVKKVYQPCKFLYSCVGTPAKPTTLHVSSECWSHDYVCPKTNKRITKHACNRMHPGESGWRNEWNMNRNFRVVNRFAALNNNN